LHDGRQSIEIETGLALEPFGGADLETVRQFQIQREFPGDLPVIMEVQGAVLALEREALGQSKAAARRISEEKRGNTAAACGADAQGSSP